MFEAIKQFVSDLTGGGKHPNRFEETDYRLAAAALLVHVAAIDGNLSGLEQAKLHALIKRCFGLDDTTTDALLAEATQAEHEAIDLYHFTSLLNRSLDEAGRQRIIAMMWEVACVDQRIDEFEDNLIWRAADLLGVSSRDRIHLRQEVTRRGGGGESA